MFRQLRLALIAMAALSAPALAQAPGRITGLVTDDRQVPVEGAQISVLGTRSSAASGPDGRFRILGVAAGTYELRAARIGRAPNMTSGVIVRSGEETKVDI